MVVLRNLAMAMLPRCVVVLIQACAGPAAITAAPPRVLLNGCETGIFRQRHVPMSFGLACARALVH
jgi:hypothetical protein